MKHSGVPGKSLPLRSLSGTPEMRQTLTIIGLKTRSECNCLSDIYLYVPKALSYKLAILFMDSINWRI